MARSTVPKSTDDYVPQELLKELSANINQPDKFAEIFCAAAKKQKIIDDCLKENIKNVLATDIETRGNLKSIVESCINDDFRFLFKKIGAVVGAFIFILVGAIITAICNKCI